MTQYCCYVVCCTTEREPRRVAPEHSSVQEQQQQQQQQWLVPGARGGHEQQEVSTLFPITPPKRSTGYNSSSAHLEARDEPVLVGVGEGVQELLKLLGLDHLFVEAGRQGLAIQYRGL